MSNGSTILSMEKAAEVCGLSIRQFRRAYYETDDNPLFKIGRKFFVLRPELEKWMEKRRQLGYKHAVKFW